jgi:hypothetical protein
LPNCWRPFFLVLPKLDGCQVDLPNYWSCSKMSHGKSSYIIDKLSRKSINEVV